MLDRPSPGERVIDFVLHAFLAAAAALSLLPFWIMLMAAFTDDLALRRHGYLPWISEFSLEAFRWVLSGSQIQVGYLVTIFVTVVGTLASLFVMSMLAYVMALKRLRGRSALAFYVFFTMIFVPGIIPWFLTTRNLLGLKDNIWALILPMLVQPFWVFVLRNFFAALPSELLESAYIDGASDATILFRIVLPLSTPVLATVGLFMAVAYWNDWYLGVMLLDFAPWRPLPIIVLRMVNNAQAIQEAMAQPGVAPNLASLPTLSIRMATALVTIGPVMLFYPFVQRYFVKGLTLGSIKG